MTRIYEPELEVQEYPEEPEVLDLEAEEPVEEEAGPPIPLELDPLQRYIREANRF